MPELRFQEAKENLGLELLGSIEKSPSDFLERLIVIVVIKMGYGGSRKEAGQAMGKSGDGGIAGIIKEDVVSHPMLQQSRHNEKEVYIDILMATSNAEKGNW